MKRLAHLLTSLLLATLPAQSESPDQLRSAAERGEARAQFDLARAHLRGIGVDRDPRLALAWMEKAAQQGFPDAIGGLGYFFAEGIAVEKNETRAAEQFRVAAEKGSAKAQLNYGQWLCLGRAVARDVAAGLRWIERAAGQGLPEAQYAFATVALFGEYGQPVDSRAACTRALPAAERGHAPAQNLVGVLHRDGQLGKIDLAEAERWFRRAAAQGERRAQSNLGHLLGPTVAQPDPAKRAEALQWIVLAARQSDGSALATLEEIRRTSSPAETAAAERAADAFKPIPE